MLRNILKVVLLTSLGVLTTWVTLCPAEWHPVKPQGVDCTMRKVKDPGLMPKLRDQEAAVTVEARRKEKYSDL